MCKFRCRLFPPAIALMKRRSITGIFSANSSTAAATTSSAPECLVLKPKKHLVVLGTGWGGYSFFRSIDKDLYKVTIVSPRNHFLFTPLVASTTVGTLEFRSIIQPVREKKFENRVDFRLGAEAVHVDFEEKRLRCTSVLDKKSSKTVSEFFDVHYDKLIISVGALSNTFGIKGVREYALFLKEISDARKIRNRLLSNFERASLPNTKRDEVENILHVVIVGGGPTGVEFGAELYDFINQDIAKLYKTDTSFNIHVTLVEGIQILQSFDKRLQSYAEKKMHERPNFRLIKSQVVEVKPDSVVLQDGQVIPCGLVVWSTGLAPRPFVKNLDIEKNKQGQETVLELITEKNTVEICK